MTEHTKKCTCTCACCGCTEPATTEDEEGQPICDECLIYMALPDGTMVCARQTDGFEACHECGHGIEWGRIETGNPNVRLGNCACGPGSWLNRENGGDWDEYSYDID